MPLSATGGHGDVNGMSPYLRFEGFSGIANGVDQIREKIRFEVKYGADLIKVLASAGVRSHEESVGAPQYTQEELIAVVEEAATWGRKVGAHAPGAEAIKRAVHPRGAPVEHGRRVDDEAILLIEEPGKFADVIGVVGDPLQDVTVLEHVGFVMKGGQIVKDSLTGGAKAAR